MCEWITNYDVQAVIYYHLQQFATALSVLEPLYQNIEPIDEVCATRGLHRELLSECMTVIVREASAAHGIVFVSCAHCIFWVPGLGYLAKSLVSLSKLRSILCSILRPTALV
jgi:hypothetical protein